MPMWEAIEAGPRPLDEGRSLAKNPFDRSRRWPVDVATERRTRGIVRGGPRVVMLAFPGADLLDVAGPCAVFDAFAQAPGRPEGDTAPGYRIEGVSTRKTLSPGGILGGFLASVVPLPLSV